MRTGVINGRNPQIVILDRKMTENLKIEPEVIDDIYFQLNVKRPSETFQRLLEESLIKKAYLMGYYECENKND
jgi:hypothetical protein